MLIVLLPVSCSCWFVSVVSGLILPSYSGKKPMDLTRTRENEAHSARSQWHLYQMEVEVIEAHC